MLKFFTLPKDPEILKKDIGLIKTFRFTIYLCALYQAVTEYSFFRSLFDFDFWGGSFIAFIIALLFTIALEYLALSSLDYVFDLYQEKKNDWTIRFLMPLGVLITCYIASVSISLSGVPELVKSTTATPTLSTTTKIDSDLINDRSLINVSFSNDSLLITQNFDTQISNINSIYESKIFTVEKGLYNFKALVDKKNKWAIIESNKIKRKASNLKAERDEKKGKLLSEKSESLTALLDSKTKELSDIKTSYYGDKKNINDFNSQLNSEYNSTISSRTSKGKFGVFFTIAWMIFCTSFIKNSLHKAGVKSHYQVDQSDFESSYFEMWIHYLLKSNKVKRRNKLTHKINSIPDYEKPKQPKVNIVYENQDFTKYKDPYKLEEAQQNLDDNSASFPVAEKSVSPLKQNKSETKVKQKSVSNPSETKVKKNETKAETLVKQATQPKSETKVKQKSVSESNETKNEKDQDISIETIIDKRYLKQRCKQSYLRSIKETSTAEVRGGNKKKYVLFKKRLTQLGVKTKIVTLEKGNKSLVFEE